MVKPSLNWVILEDIVKNRGQIWWSVLIENLQQLEASYFKEYSCEKKHEMLSLNHNMGFTHTDC